MTDELCVDDVPMTRHIEGVGSTDREDPVKGSGPGREIGIGVDRGVRGLLDEITGEHHQRGVFIVGRGYDHDQVRRGVATARVGDGCGAVAEIDGVFVRSAPRRAQGRDGAVDFRGVGPVMQRVVANLVGGRRQVFDHLGRAVDVGFGELRGSQDVVEVLVRQHNMGDRTPGDLPRVALDSGRFGKRGACVDQQRSGAPLHQPDGDIAERQPTAMYAGGELLPREMHQRKIAPAEGCRKGCRKYDSEMTHTSKTETIRVDQYVAAPPHTVWRMLTESELLRLWLAEGQVAAVVGHQFTLDMPGYGKQPCKVLEVDEPHRYVYTFTAAWTLAWRLEAEGAGTRVFLELSGFDLKNKTMAEALNWMGAGWRDVVLPRLAASAVQA